jgi:hypothetical protein
MADEFDVGSVIGTRCLGTIKIHIYTILLSLWIIRGRRLPLIKLTIEKSSITPYLW